MSDHDDRAPDGARRFTGWHMLAITVSFFAVIVAVNMTLAAFAARSWTGLVVKNGYVASQNYNHELAEARAQAARGWRSTLSPEHGRVVVSIVDHDGAPVALSDMKITIGRPAFEQMDREARLVHQGGGRYVADLALAPGLWTARIENAGGGAAYRQEFRFTVPEAGRRP